MALCWSNILSMVTAFPKRFYQRYEGPEMKQLACQFYFLHCSVGPKIALMQATSLCMKLSKPLGHYERVQSGNGFTKKSFKSFYVVCSNLAFLCDAFMLKSAEASNLQQLSLIVFFHFVEISVIFPPNCRNMCGQRQLKTQD